MASKKDKHIEKEYGELRLRYALENPKIERLCADWIKNYEKWNELYEAASCDSTSFDSPLPSGVQHAEMKAETAFTPLLIALDKLGFSYEYALDIYYDYCRISGKQPRFNKDMVLASVFVKRKIRAFECCSLADYRKLVRVLEKDSFENNDGWFLEKYKTFSFSKKFERYDHNWEVINPAHCGINAFNKNTKKFYFPIKNLAFIEADNLAKGRYLTLKIDLFKKRENIETELQTILNYFKLIVDKLIFPLGKIGQRRQQIELYKRRLRVYHLIQQKGKKWTEIARELFPEDASPESARIKVMDDYKEAQRLIREGLP